MPRSADLAEVVIERAEDFWRAHVRADVPPEITAASRHLRHLVRRPELVATVSAAAVEAWLDYIKAETLALSLERGRPDGPSRVAKVTGAEIRLGLSGA